MPVKMSTSEIKMSKAEIHAKDVDALKAQCDNCKRYKPDNVHGGCEIRYKLIVEDSNVAWKHKQLFFNFPGMKCKQFSRKK